MPSVAVLGEVKRRGIDLYAVLEHQGTRLTAEMRLGIDMIRSPERRFNAVTEAHINLFFYMLTLNLAIHVKIDNVQKQLRTKLSFLEERLRSLLHEYIYADKRGWIAPDNLHSSDPLWLDIAPAK
jgi:hypothetical protein